MMMADREALPSPLAEPDVMNDPAYETNTKGKEKSTDEQDTCRICRGEGSKDEPLFYPCKCSGSIKFVHQDCLMEWLSHSQKKHCELCKTSFRFTKLYHPQMPSTVPLPIFLRQAAIHTFKSFLTWSRFHLVVLVWLGWLPWCMRTVWRGLFWIGDGGWINWQAVQKQSLLSAQKRLDSLAAEGTTPVGRELLSSKQAATTAILSRISDVLPPILSPVSQTLNLTAGEPTVFRLAKRLLQVMIGQSAQSSTSLNSTALPNTTVTVRRLAQRSPSWLSEVSFLRSLTRWNTLNNILIDTLEGQLITLFVVITFILVFLIREWVVQQQPGFNMGAGFNAGAVAERQGEEVPALQQLARQHAEQRLGRGFQGEAAVVADNDGNRQAEVARRPRILARPRARRQIQPLPNERQDVGDQENIVDVLGPENANDLVPTTSTSPLGSLEMERSRSRSDAEPSNITQRPGMPTRDALTRATEIQRTIEEHSRASGQDWPGLEVFMDLWKRADSQPSEVLKIIEGEGRTEDLGWIVAAMRRLENSSSTERPAQIKTDSEATEYKEKLDGGQRSDISHEAWQVLGAASSQPRETWSKAAQRVPLSIPSSSDDSANTDVDKDAAALDLLLEKDSARQGEPSTSNISVEEAINIPERSELNSANLFGDAGTSLNDQSQQSNTSSDHDNSQPNIPISEKTDTSPDAEAIPSSAPSQGFTVQEALDQIRPVQSDVAPGTVQQEVPSTGPAPQGLWERLADWLWGGITPPTVRPEEQGEDDEHVVQDVADEAPFVPVARRQLVLDGGNNAENPAQDPDVMRAAAEAGIDAIDPEAVEDGEDLEGVMELIGMQGPLAGLVQNGMFSAVLISMTVFFGIWVPYIAGKLFLVFLANPVSLLVKLPLRWASAAADLIIDAAIFVAGCAFYWIDTIVRLACTPVGWLLPFVAKMNENKILAATAKSYAQSAVERLARMFVATGDSLSDSDIPVFSIIAHESLHTIEQRLATLTAGIVDAASAVAHSSPAQALSGSNHISGMFTKYTKELAFSLLSKAHYIIAMAPSLLKVNPLRISLDIPQRTSPLDYNLAYWNTQDRIIAILLGYLFFSVIGAVYIKISASFRDNGNGEKVDGNAADILYQAGGVMKVILIISIEMIVFPLYCGLLLDAALLPLFENASAMSRFHFTMTSPATSLFVHWFVGTCYMFHFALFVSMCRKIMRSGVLYFIRDPDDPTFHPVRDVLERNVATQLRKIAFSALVYGALVIVCLGGVVWGLDFAFNGVFPIHWSSNEPVLEFPVDLLFYNFLMPLAVKFFKPSRGLNKMYGWWFRKCARLLRLTHFLFGEKMEDEEGHHVRRTWWDVFSGKKGDVQQPVIGSDRRALFEDRNTSVYFLRDGKYVRAPASDQVRIPKGGRTFVEVDEDGERADGFPDTELGLHGRQNRMFSKVYIPPFFRLRVCAFISLIWLFAATTGVGFTILPLVFGRFIFAYLIPVHPRMNDIYAFSIGIYLLGGPLYLVLHYHKALTSLSHHLQFSRSSTPFAILHQCANYTFRAMRLTYFYASITFLLPSLFALIMEAYLVIPLHTYVGGGITERHVIHFIQDWTLGVLYVKMAGRLLLWNENTRPALALRAIVRNGWLDPDVRLATRSFIFPATLLMTLALLLPLPLGWVGNQMRWWYVSGGKQQQQQQVMEVVLYRYAYPAVLALGMGCLFLVMLGRAVKGWRMRVRDEVYLIGERLHNFGERRGLGAGGAGGGSGGMGITGRRVR